MSDVNQKTSRQTELNNYKIPGMRTPRNRQEAEKPKEGRKTMKRLFMYFTDEKYMLLDFYCPYLWLLSAPYMHRHFRVRQLTGFRRELLKSFFQFLFPCWFYMEFIAFVPYFRVFSVQN